MPPAATPAPPIDEIVTRIQEEARRRNRFSLREGSGPAPALNAARLTQLRGLLDQAEAKAYPPTVWPPDLRRFPFNLGFVQRVALGFYGLLLGRTRDSLLPLCRALRDSLALLEETQAALAAARAVLATGEAERRAAEAHFRNQLWLQMRLLTSVAERSAPAAAPAAAGADAARQEVGHALDAVFAAFAEEFRGSWDDVRRRADVYAPLLEELLGGAGAGPLRVLDLGCGRGEWLDVVRSRGWTGQGVETNVVMVETCRSRGLQVVEAEALEHLRALEAGSLDAITGFHLAEHLPFEALWVLLGECLRVLRPGGLLVLETPNPECLLVTTGDFYIDPTHRQPLHPDTLAFLARQLGFAGVRAWFIEDDGTTRTLQSAAGRAGAAPAERLQVTARDYCLLAAKPQP